MLKLSRLLIVISVVLAFMFAGCATTTQQTVKPGQKAGEKSVLERVKDAGFQIVDFDYVKDKAGVRKLKQVVLVDARPERKYLSATIPGALNLPDVKFEKYYSALEALLKKSGASKDVEIIVFCGGFHCVKSLHDAKYLKRKGFSNIKVYLAGMPDWTKHDTYTEISVKSASKLVGKSIFVDARPARMFKKISVQGSINIPDTKFMKKDQQAKYLKLLPQDKNAPIIVYCGGYHCIKSHNVANILVHDYGYSDIKVMAAGLPGWKKAGLLSESVAADSQNVKGLKVAAVRIPAGPDEGTVDKKWFSENVINPETRPSNVFVVDVRTPTEFENGHVAGAVNVPVDLIFASDDSGCTVVPPKIDKLTAKGDVIFMCASGGRAGDMYFELIESCNYAKKDKIHFLDAHVEYAGGKCTIK